ncbi:MAG: saccharopine dehydrogenase family protein, partial [Alphaproteobacteria bacterium]|nr:saccharopine dehydrogenase family protein [Alphaproteobacteria bacterium]
MSNVLVIGAGGVGSVAVHKMAMLNEQFQQITLASRRQFKCDEIAASVNQRTGIKIATAELDADDVDATARLIDSTGAKLVVNLALPYQDKFAEQGLMALLGSGFDPGVTNVFTAYIRKHHIAQMKTLDILDCNG